MEDYVGDVQLIRLLDDVKIAVHEDLIEDWKKRSLYTAIKQILLNEKNTDIKLLNYLFIGWLVCNVSNNTYNSPLSKEEIVD